MAATQENMTCTVCMEVYRSPRFLPCHHTLCLPCLEELAKKHGNIIPCPTCRAPATVPPDGVSALQVNFYFTEEALEEARNEKRQSMCPVHSKDVAIFHCTQCDKSLCLKCKLTKHEGHTTEELSDTIARCKKTIENELHTFAHTIQSKKQKLESCKQNEKRAQEKRAAIMEQIAVRYELIVAMAGKYRDQALQELQKTCDDLEKDLSTDTKQVEDELSSLLQLHERAQRSLGSACDTEVLQVEKEMRCKDGSGFPLREFNAGLSDQTYRPVLHGDFSNYIEDHYMKTFIGSPVKQSFSNKKIVDIVRLGRCGEGECPEVHALRQEENGDIDVYYGGTGGDYSKEKGVCFSSDGSRGTETEYRCRVSCGSRKHDIWRWKYPTSCNLGSKNNDVCFCGDDTLLIADWMNDCVHVTTVSDFGIRFVCYLPGSGDIVRPTALNLDLNGQLLIGCGDGWVLRLPVDF